MAKKYVTTLTQDIMSNLQRLNYDVAQHDRNLRLLLIEGGPDIITSDTYNYYKDEGRELNFKLEQAKADIEKLVFPEGWWEGGHQYNTFMNYLTNEVTVTVFDTAGIKILEGLGYVLK